MKQQQLTIIAGPCSVDQNNISEIFEIADITVKNQRDQTQKAVAGTRVVGGLEGGVTNGMPIVVRVYHKPISTLYKPLQTVDIQTKKVADATVERSDICIVPRAGVVSEAMLAYVLSQIV